MQGNIWVIAAHWQGTLSDPTFEVLALGRELADALGVSLDAVVMGHDIAGLSPELGAADRIVAIDDAALAHPIGDVAARTLAVLAAERQPGLVLLPITNVGWDLIGLLPTLLESPMVNFVHDARVADGRIEASSLMYGGKMDARVAVPGGTAVLAVLPGARPADQGRIAGAPPVDQVPMEVQPGRISFVGYREPEAGDVDLTQLEVLVGVGRGMENEANLEVAEDLAAHFGGAVCGSRPVIDQGWLGLSRQVGKSGVTVKPRLYFAAGISGAPEHSEGIKDAELIMAFNTDPDAPIFSLADYGAIGDATDLLEALSEAVEERKG